MVDFNTLPLEIKRMIAKQAHYSDDHYRRRTGKPSVASKEQLRGQAVPCLALVNKEMRRACLRWLICKVKSSKVKDEMFEYHILPSSELASYVTSFEFENKVNLERIAFIVLYVLPRLPNLRRITIHDQNFFSPFADLLGLALEQDWTREKFVWGKLLEIAGRVHKLHLTFSDVEQIEALVAATSGILRTLDLRPLQDCPPLSSPDSPILSVLDQCSSLRHLKLRISPQSNTSTPSSIIHETALSHTYAFRNTLTILDICTVQKRTLPDTPFDISTLHFASLFPGLLDLHLCSQTFHFDESESTPLQTLSFPSLLRLDLELQAIGASVGVIERMSMPRIRLLYLHLGDSNNLTQSVHQNPSHLFALADQVKHLESTLQTVQLRSRTGLYSPFLTFFIDILSPHSFEILTTWDQGEAESLVDIGGAGDESLLPPPETLLTGLIEGSKELIEWAKERIEEIEETKDLSGARQVYKALKNVKELRKWLKE